MQTSIGNKKTKMNPQLRDAFLNDLKGNSGYELIKKIEEISELGKKDNSMTISKDSNLSIDIGENFKYLDVLNIPKLESRDIADSGIFPVVANWGNGIEFGVFQFNAVIDQNDVKLSTVVLGQNKYIEISGAKIELKKGEFFKKTIRILVDDDIHSKVTTLISEPSFFKENNVKIRNILDAEIIDLNTDAIYLVNCVEYVDGNTTGKAPITAKNFEKFISISKNTEDLAPAPALFSYDEDGKLNIFDEKYDVYNIDNEYNKKIDLVITPFSEEVMDIKFQLNNVIIDSNDKQFVVSSLASKSENIYKSYQSVIDRYSSSIYFEMRAMSELNRATTELGVFLKTYNIKISEENISDSKKDFLNSMLNEKRDGVIESMKKVDDYLQSVLNFEKTELENTIGKNGELRKRIPELPDSILRTTAFDNILKYVLKKDKYRDTAIIIGHAGIGKSFASKIASALTKKPLYQLTGHYDFSLSDLVGTIKQNDKGYFVIAKGPLVKLAETGGTLILDEFNALPQEVMKSLNGLLDEIKTGKNGVWNVQIQGTNIPINVHKDLRIVFTGNPSGYSAEYGNLSPITTDLSRRTAVTELPPIEIDVVKNGNNKIIRYPILDSYFSNLDLRSMNANFAKKTDDDLLRYKKVLQSNTTKFLTEFLTLLGKGFIDKSSQAGADAKNFYALVRDPDANFDDLQAIKNVALSIPSIVINRINEIVRNSEGDPRKDLMEYLESYIFETIRTDNNGEIAIKQLTEAVNN